jgi:hypothetical protein
VFLALVVVGAGVGLVVRETWAGGGETQVAGKPAAASQKANPQADTREGTKAEVESLRKEVVKLREEISRLRDELRPGISSFAKEPLYSGKPLTFWLDQYKDAEPAFRAQAVVALGHLARNNKQLIPVLLSALSDDDSESFGSREVAGQAILVLRFLGEKVVPGLMEVLQSKSLPRVGRKNAAIVWSRWDPRPKPQCLSLRMRCKKKTKDSVTFL